MGIFLPSYVNRAMWQTSKREEMKPEVNKLLHKKKISDAITEVMIVSFDYRNQNPVLFTKMAAKNYPKDMDVELEFAMAASTATPAYFEPMVRKNIGPKKET
jgi:patatin-like phospholipase/acyl hydrolase